MLGEKTGGRSFGTPNRSTKDLFEKAKEMGFDPFTTLAHIAMGNWKALGYTEAEVITLTKAGGRVLTERITMDHRLAAASQAAQYLYPKRKAVEIIEESTDEKIERLIINRWGEKRDLSNASEASGGSVHQEPTEGVPVDDQVPPGGGEIRPVLPPGGSENK